MPEQIGSTKVAMNNNNNNSSNKLPKSSNRAPRKPSRTPKDHNKDNRRRIDRDDDLINKTAAQWYAGSGFERSPAAHTLPHPTDLLAGRATTGSNSPPQKKSLLPGQNGISIPLGHYYSRREDDHHHHHHWLSSSCPAAPIQPAQSFPVNTRTVMQPSRSQESLVKGRTVDVPSAGGATTDLDEMTKSVKRLLNLPT